MECHTIPSYQTGHVQNVHFQPKAYVQATAEEWKSVNYHNVKRHGLGTSKQTIDVCEKEELMTQVSLQRVGYVLHKFHVN